ncbi:alpha/beta hydrolase [Pseudomonas fluorescens]|uniref:alpha/beta hydrolase n=1 Tax=Pseudomonas fluorescens TaxID=294 RepID=UPI00123F9171|nr:alpha/beta hydrolase [Pseudomonas fluorescens]VVM47552.1 hypothetical protein PS639_00606 [Pseudomonas fluorescens]
MFIVTNREVKPSASGIKQLGLKPNSEGPNELRLAEAEKDEGKWKIKILPNILTAPMRKAVGLPSDSETAYASEYVARIIFERILQQKKNLLFFVHGYNNDVEAVLDRAQRLEELYGVEVLSFSWPANGGGAAGVASYKSDKRDARASVGALDRCLGRMAELFRDLTMERNKDLEVKVDAKFKTAANSERRDALLVELQEKTCPFTVNMMAHSMGNYLYEHTLLSVSSYANLLLFDNVVLVAADANNLDHPKWVDRIPCRKSVFVTINENDQALRLARAKIGDDQLPRLGHYRHNLEAKQAIYVDFTEAPGVGSSHAYFEGEPVADVASAPYRFFYKTLNGQSAHDDLAFDSGIKAYRLK